MGKLIMWNMMTLDGCFEANKKWDLDWHTAVWGEELEQFSIEQLQSCSVLLFGRVTYEGMASYWKSETGEIAGFMNSIPKIVVSKTLRRADWNNTRLLNENVENEIAALKRWSEKNLYIFGSAELCSTLMQKGLIDEYRLCLAPIILGSGNPLFKARAERLNMTLIETRPLKTGGIILRYQPVH